MSPTSFYAFLIDVWKIAFFKIKVIRVLKEDKINFQNKKLAFIINKTPLLLVYRKKK